MPMHRRTLIVLVAVIALTTVVATTGPAAGGSTHRPSDRLSEGPNLVKIFGEETLEPNVLITSTFRFSPEVLFPGSGERVRWIDRDESDDPHTITLVRRSDLPDTVQEAFSCRPCNDAINAHFAGDQPKLHVNVGERGLDQPGDSLLLLPGESIAAGISAATGTNLYYLCAIHPWMQGKLVVG
jgi:plastocyanin